MKKSVSAWPPPVSQFHAAEPFASQGGNLKLIRVIVPSVASVIVFASVLVHPFGPVKAAKSAHPLLAGTDIDPAIFRVLERSCQNCHSEKTEWPWYSYIAPMSWLVEGDVSQARSHVNLPIGMNIR
jgi:hypothetical protein